MPSVDDHSNGEAVRPEPAPLRGTGLLKGSSSGVLKAVTISDEPEQIPLFQSKIHSPSLTASESPRKHIASITGKKLGGRPSHNRDASINSLSHQISNLDLHSAQAQADLDGTNDRQRPNPSALLAQVVMWLHEEKAKRAARAQPDEPSLSPMATATRPKTADNTQSAEDGLALDKLERILSGHIGSASNNVDRRSSFAKRKGSLAKRLSKRGSVAASSETEYRDGDATVPNVEAVLDNSKTMKNPLAQHDNDLSTVKANDKDHWIAFKSEVVRLTHTLRLKGWRRVPIERGGDIDIERLSGALTNAVYVVSPPKDLPDPPLPSDSTTPIGSRRKPSKILLRIYGPQVEHLIDREGELAILRRLARKRIGPRLLGTFSNGRFEEFFHARTLTPEDLRVSATSKQIAKRMRELHDGIELLEEERDAGPFVWRNWDKWVARCEQVVTWLDKRIIEQQEQGAGAKPTKRWMQRGFVCGVEWPAFKKTVEKYRKQIEKTHGGKKGVREQLVFAHNDTQYGNLLRLQPVGESPLLLPDNEHRQLVVIDFEYASANTPGMEFANHFTEWCYNYHHPTKSYACNTAGYPSPEEQHRFIRSYVMHRPQFAPSASSTPKITAKESSISNFMLDARTPTGGGHMPDYFAEERVREEQTEKEIQALLHETKIWRIANSAQWVAWGIVQAKVPELDDMQQPAKKNRTAAILERVRDGMEKRIEKLHVQPMSDPIGEEVREAQEDAKADRPEGSVQEEARREGGEDEDEDEQEFDYLTYAQDRAFFFWGDCVQLGLVKEEELPEGVREQLKMVRY